MFSNKVFSLKEFQEEAALSIMQDCEFSFVGKVDTSLDNRLVACSQKKYYDRAISTSGIAGVLIPEGVNWSVPSNIGVAHAGDPQSALCKIQNFLADEASGQWISEESVVATSAKIFPGVYIAPNDVYIGEGVTILPGSVILPRTVIGVRSKIGPGVTVGSEAFQLDASSSNKRMLMQSGGVIIGRNVDIHSQADVHRAVYGGFTVIGDESSIDCRVVFGHDCICGSRVTIAGGTILGGRVMVGEDTVIGVGCSIRNGCKIGAGATVSMGSVVTRDVPDGGHVTGYFAVDHHRWLSFVKSITSEADG